MRLNIIGASGHAKVVADIAVKCGYTDIVFWENDETIKECAGFPVCLESTGVTEGDVFAAVGNATIRKRIMERYKDRIQPTLIHPSAVIADRVKIGSGSVVMAGSVVNPDSVIGKGVILNTGCSVDHDCAVEDFSHISVGAHLCGSVRIGEGTWIGAGSIIINNISICSGCIIGAGAVVIKDINEPGTYVGVPAKKEDNRH